MNNFMPKQQLRWNEKFHERYKVPKLIQEEIDNLNNLTFGESKTVYSK